MSEEQYNIEEVKQIFCDFYNTAITSGSPLAIMELCKISKMTDEEVLEDVIKNGLL